VFRSLDLSLYKAYRSLNFAPCPWFGAGLGVVSAGTEHGLTYCVGLYSTLRWQPQQSP